MRNNNNNTFNACTSTNRFDIVSWWCARDLGSPMYAGLVRDSVRRQSSCEEIVLCMHYVHLDLGGKTEPGLQPDRVLPVDWQGELRGLPHPSVVLD